MTTVQEYDPNTPEVTRKALLQLNPMVCPARIYDEVLHANWAMTVSNIIKDAAEKGWTH